MNNVVEIFKPIGLTPLQALEEFRKNNPEYKDVKLSYIGRLDPMANGIMLILIGEENKNREKYLNLDKEYAFDILFGFNTDTFDILGKVLGDGDFIGDLKNVLEKEVAELKGKIVQEYPSYSGKTVDGKKLFDWAKEDKLDEIEIPTKEIEIYDIKLKDVYEINVVDLRNLIFERINKVTGDFRQQEILEIWKDKLSKHNDIQKFKVASFSISCSSGTYIRSIANNLGKKLSYPAIALNITRTKFNPPNTEC